MPSETECSACAVGTYADSDGLSSCTSCPAGFSCLDVAASPAACMSGYYSLGGTGDPCVLCPAGHECSDASVSPVQCAAGSYARNGSVTCTTCEVGRFCPDVDGLSESTACTVGHYQNKTGESSCLPCPAGHNCADVSATPQPCPAGSISSQGVAECSAAQVASGIGCEEGGRR